MYDSSKNTYKDREIKELLDRIIIVHGRFVLPEKFGVLASISLEWPNGGCRDRVGSLAGRNLSSHCIHDVHHASTVWFRMEYVGVIRGKKSAGLLSLNHDSWGRAKG